MEATHMEIAGHSSGPRLHSCQVKILDDTPNCDPSLRTLDHVVDAIAGVIENPRQKGGKGILLEGTWGSGKSSVVKRLRDRYIKNDDVRIVIFDAWGHQGDPLRRSFLERLLDTLSAIGRTDVPAWIDGETSKKERDKLAGALKETSAETVRALTLEGAVAAAAALLIPAGIVFLNLAYSDKGDALTWVSRQTAGLLGWALTLSPLVVVFAFWAPRFILWMGRDTARPFPRPAQFLGENSSEKVHTKSYTTPDPTSIEFSQAFEHIMEAALQGHNSRQLVIVAENLDRVTTDDALALWSTMRGIFEDGERTRPDWLDRLWLLVPIDPEAAERLWRRAKCPAASDVDQGKPAGDGRYFLDKTFQARFRVPHPMLTCWSSFLEEKLREAIPCCAKQGDIPTIVRLFDQMTPEAPLRITPRLIIQYANRLASLHAVWGKDIPLGTQAAYLLAEAGIRQSPVSLAQGTALTPTSISILNQENWNSDFARMHYGVRDPKEAAEIALWDVTRNALCENEHKSLDGIKENDWFPRVVESIIARDSAAWAVDDGVTLTNAALGLAYVDPNGTPQFASAWKALAARAPRKWSEFGKAQGEGIALILVRSGPVTDALAMDVIRSISGDTPIKDIDKREGGAEQWRDGALRVVEAFQEMEMEPYVEEYLEVPSDAAFYLRVMAALADKGVGAGVARHFTPRCQAVEVTNLLSQVVGDQSVSDVNAKAVGMMTLTNVNWPWSTVLDSLNMRVRTDTSKIDAPRAAAYITLLSHLWHRGKDCAQLAQEVLLRLTNTGHIADFIMKTKNADLDEATALCAFAIFSLMPDHEGMNSQGQSTSGLAEYDGLMTTPASYGTVPALFARQVESYMPLQQFLAQVQKAKAGPLAGFVLRNIARENEAAASYFPRDLVEASLDALQGVFGRETAEFLGLLPCVSAVITHVISRGFTPDDSDLYVLLMSAVAGRPIERDLIVFLQRGIGGRTKDNWLAAIRGPSCLNRLAVDLAARGISLSPNEGPLSAALEEYAAEVAKKNVSMSARWSELRSVLTVAAAEKTDRSALLHALSPDSTASGRRTILQVLGPRMKSELGINDMADTVVAYYTPRLVSAGPEELKWLAQAFKNDMSPSRASADSLRTSAENTLKDAGIRLDTRQARQVLVQEIAGWLSRH
jgi:hypothetical protein